MLSHCALVVSQLSLATVAAGLVGSLLLFLLDPFVLLDPFLKGFAAAALGGLNSLPGAVAGALIRGVGESLAGAYLTIQFKNSLAFLIIIMVLLIRPEGLLGKEFKERVQVSGLSLRTGSATLSLNDRSSNAWRPDGASDRV